VLSVNGYVAFFDVSVSPSNSNEDDDDDDDDDEDNDDEDDNDEREEKEEKLDNDEERLVAFRLYLFFRSPFPSLTRSFASLCTLLSYSFISFLLRCSINEVGRGLLPSYTPEYVFFHHNFRYDGRLIIFFFEGLKIRKT